MSRALLLPLTVLLTFVAEQASAASWNETANGDLSNVGLTPSHLTLEIGTNLIQGNFGAGDLDYLTITIPQGYTLSAIITGLNNNQGQSKSFIGVQSGTVMTVSPNAGNAQGLLGWTHFGGADGVDILPAIGLAKAGSTGFTPPLSAGDYTFWINETSSDAGLTYDLDFQVQAVPIASTGGLMISGLLSLFAFKRRAVIA